MLDARMAEIMAMDDNKKAKKGKSKFSGAAMVKKLNGHQ